MNEARAFALVDSPEKFPASYCGTCQTIESEGRLKFLTITGVVVLCSSRSRRVCDESIIEEKENMKPSKNFQVALAAVFNLIGNSSRRSGIRSLWRQQSFPIWSPVTRFFFKATRLLRVEPQIFQKIKQLLSNC